MQLSGIYPPIVTPFKDDEIDLAGLRHNTDRWMRTGLRGLLALGSNGEAAFVDEDEAERIVATVREGVPRDRVLLVGTGRRSTRAPIAATVRAARAGAIVALANAVPGVCVRLFDLVRAGLHDEARALQRRLTPFAQAVTGGFCIAGLKLALTIAGYVGGDVRAPLRPAKPEAREVLQRLYTELVTD